MKKIMMLTSVLLIAPLVGCKGNTPKKDNENYLCFTCNSAGGGSLFFIHESLDEENFNLQYSYDKKTWEDVDMTQLVYPFVFNSNENIYFRGDNPTGFNTANPPNGLNEGIGRASSFAIADGDFKVSGNVMSLIQKTKFDSLTEIPCDYCFSRLFYVPLMNFNSRRIEYGGIVDASELLLPATKLTDYCYYGMFYDNSNLKKAPQLPALQLTNNCYEKMFGGCTELKTAPDLLANDNGLAPNCYASMFSDSSVTNLKVGFDERVFESGSISNAVGYSFTNDWLYSCPEIGTFSWKGTTEPTDRSCHTIPNGWEIKTW